MGDVTAYVAKVVADIEATRATFADFDRSGVKTHAVPFFGDVESAQVLTVGVNPSAGEFVGRAWPDTMTPSALAEHLLIQRVGSHQATIRKWLDGQSRTAT